VAAEAKEWGEEDPLLSPPLRSILPDQADDVMTSAFATPGVLGVTHTFPISRSALLFAELLLIHR